MESAAEAGRTAERHQAGSEQMTVALLLAAFAAAATVASDRNHTAEADDGESADGGRAALGWLDNLHASIRSDLQK